MLIEPDFQTGTTLRRTQLQVREIYPLGLLTTVHKAEIQAVILADVFEPGEPVKGLRVVLTEGKQSGEAFVDQGDIPDLLEAIGQMARLVEGSPVPKPVPCREVSASTPGHFQLTLVKEGDRPPRLYLTCGKDPVTLELKLGELGRLQSLIHQGRRVIGLRLPAEG